MPLNRRRPEDKSEVWRPRKSVRLYLDDVDDVLAVLKHTDPQVEATTPDFAGEITTAEELKVAGQRTLSNLVLSAGSSDFGINVELRTPVAVRIAPRDALDLAGASQRVQEVLSSRQERFGGWRPGNAASNALSAMVTAVVATVIGGLSLLLALPSSDSGSDTRSGLDISVRFWVTAAAILLAALVAAAWRMAAGPNRSPTATIVLAFRADAPTWWERNRTSVLIGLVTNVGTGLLFFLLGLWLGGN